MLSFYDPSPKLQRRQFLRVGTLGLGGISLPLLMPRQSEASPSPSFVTDRSVIFLFMHGGPSQTETFDPKMTAPAGVCSATGEVQTTIPGITFGSTLSNLARHAHEIAVVRSFATGDGRHDIKPIVCRDTLNANLGSIYSRVSGASHPKTGIPSNVALFPRAVDSEAQKGNMNFGRFDAVGGLGTACAPFVPGGGGLWRDMQLTMRQDRFDDRRGLLRDLDDLRRLSDHDDSWASVDPNRRQAFQTILGGVTEAFDLSRESAQTIARYNTAPLVRPDQISRRWNNYNNYVDNARSLGKLMLLARRLCERGCGFVTVTTNFVWDMHADQNNAGVAEGMEYMGVPFDHAVSAFIEDVSQRGLTDKILLVCCGEMGRTPKINDRGGRDHWGRLAPLLIYGGGLRMGQVIGQSSRDAGEPASRAYSLQNLIATIMGTLFDVSELRLAQGIPRDISQVMTGWEPIRELV